MSPCLSPLTTPSRKTASFRFPLKDYASKLPDLRSPSGAPLMNFQIRRSTLLFVPSAPRPCPLRGRPAQTLRFTHGFGNSQLSQGLLITRGIKSCFTPARQPGMKPASRAALGWRIDCPASGDDLPPDPRRLIADCLAEVVGQIDQIMQQLQKPTCNLAEWQASRVSFIEEGLTKRYVDALQLEVETAEGDLRPPYLIPEIRRHFRQLAKRWPHAAFCCDLRTPFLAHYALCQLDNLRVLQRGESQQVLIAYTPAMTWANYAEYWEIDHIKPCADFDLTRLEECRVCFALANLRPLPLPIHRSRYHARQAREKR